MTEYCGGPNGTVDLFAGLTEKETYDEDEARRIIKVLRVIKPLTSNVMFVC